jgi:predicted DsbA family dithiol-disulfide isomerase
MMNQGNQLFGVNGTPGNVIIDRETGKFELISGAYPVESFVEAINKMKNA